MQEYVTFELHAVIRFLTATGNMTTEIHRELVQIYGENCINVSNVRRRKRDFENNCCVSLDEWCSGQLIDSLTIDNICRMCEILEADDCFTLDKIIVCMPPAGRRWSTIHYHSQCVAITKTRMSVDTSHSD